MRQLVTVLVVAAARFASATSCPAQEADFYPWEVGREWIYSDGTGAEVRVRVESLERVAAGGAQSALLLVTGPSLGCGGCAGVLLGLLKSADGSLSLTRQSYVPSDGCWWSFAPGILLLTPPLVTGATWSQTVYASMVCGGRLADSWISCEGEILERSDLTVPAGSYTVWKTRACFDPFDAWCDQVGPLQLRFPGGLYSLVSWDDRVPAERWTWGAVKNVYAR